MAWRRLRPVRAEGAIRYRGILICRRALGRPDLPSKGCGISARPNEEPPGRRLDTSYGQWLRQVPAEVAGDPNRRFVVVIATGTQSAALRVRGRVRELLRIGIYAVSGDGQVENWLTDPLVRSQQRYSTPQWRRRTSLRSQIFQIELAELVRDRGIRGAAASLLLSPFASSSS